MIEQGETAPDFTLPDQEGEDVTLSQLRGGPVDVRGWKAVRVMVGNLSCGADDRISIATNESVADRQRLRRLYRPGP